MSRALRHMARDAGKTWCGRNYTGMRGMPGPPRAGLPSVEPMPPLVVTDFDDCECKSCKGAFMALARNLLKFGHANSLGAVLRKLIENPEAAPEPEWKIAKDLVIEIEFGGKTRTFKLKHEEGTHVGFVGYVNKQQYQFKWKPGRIEGTGYWIAKTTQDNYFGASGQDLAGTIRNIIKRAHRARG